MYWTEELCSFSSLSYFYFYNICSNSKHTHFKMAQFHFVLASLSFSFHLFTFLFLTGKFTWSFFIWWKEKKKKKKKDLKQTAKNTHFSFYIWTLQQPDTSCYTFALFFSSFLLTQTEIYLYCPNFTKGQLYNCTRVRCSILFHFLLEEK